MKEPWKIQHPVLLIVWEESRSSLWMDLNFPGLSPLEPVYLSCLLCWSCSLTTTQQLKFLKKRSQTRWRFKKSLKVKRTGYRRQFEVGNWKSTKLWVPPPILPHHKFGSQWEWNSFRATELQLRVYLIPDQTSSVVTWASWQRLPSSLRNFRNSPVPGLIHPHTSTCMKPGNAWRDCLSSQSPYEITWS